MSAFSYRWQYYVKHPIQVLNDLERWIAFRTYDRYNRVEIPTLEPNYYDKDTILLHSCFALLTEYVELELGGEQYWADNFDHEKFDRRYEKESDLERKGKKYQLALYKFWNELHWPKFITRLAPYRGSRELGLKNLDQRIEDATDPNLHEDEKYFYQHHSEIAREMKVLYLWWHDIFLKRTDPSDRCGLTKYVDELYKKYGRTHRFVPTGTNGKAFERIFNGTKEEEEKYSELIKEMFDIEQDDSLEETNMLKRLIDVKDRLWS